MGCNDSAMYRSTLGSISIMVLGHLLPRSHGGGDGGGGKGTQGKQSGGQRSYYLKIYSLFKL